MKLSRTPLPEATKVRLIAHYHEIGLTQGISPERALYDVSRKSGNSAADLDALFGMPPGSAAAWVQAQSLPELDGVPTMVPVGQ